MAKKTAQPMTRAGRVIAFIEKYIVVPEGMLVGKPMVLLPEQKDFIYAVYDNADSSGRLLTRRAIFSIARKNGKTGLIAALLAAHIFGPEAKENSQIYSAARSRDQAALVFEYLAKSIRMNPKLEGLARITDSSKRIDGLAMNVTYRALSADATTAHGKSPVLTIHDELGQVVGPTDALYDALETAGGAHEEPLSLIISTQAASDTDLLSILIDDAIRTDSPSTVVRLYAAPKDADIFDEAVWYKTNFALGKFRSYNEFKETADRARRMPSSENSFRNLYLNQRISNLVLMVPPTLWKNCSGKLDRSLFERYLVAIGLDLSSTTDLTACVLAVQDPATKKVHVDPYVFTPRDTLIDRARTDRAPYQLFEQQGKLIVLPGKIVSYEMVAEYMARVTERMHISILAFDRWRINEFKREAERAKFAQAKDTVWSPVGQGFRDMTLRVEKLEQLLLETGFVHDEHPLLNMAAANAVLAVDPANNKKPEKAKSSSRIDPLVAAMMAMYALLVPEDGAKPAPVVTEKSLFFV